MSGNLQFMNIIQDMAPSAVTRNEDHDLVQSLEGVKAHTTHSNKAFVLLDKQRFGYEDRPMPKSPLAREVIVGVKATGLCGSDIHYWQHGKIGHFEVREPLVLGHESSGVVKQCGPDTSYVKIGDRVAIEPGVPCRLCKLCRKGRYNLCADVNFAATPPHDGTLTRYYRTPEDFVYKLPQSISFEEGALVEPLSVAVHCCKLAGIEYGNSVLVLGAGPIGLLCCAVARTFGAIKVPVVDSLPSRLAFALTYAATNTYQMQTITPEQNAENILRQDDNLSGFDVVIDATGAQPCISAGIYALKRGGKFIQAGLGASEITFPVAQLCAKEGSYIGSFRYNPGDYDAAVSLLKHGKVEVRSLITHSFSFEEAGKAFQNVVSRHGIKTVIRGVNPG